MGAGGSSIAKCTNDFELVIRATKEMEWLLETYFDAPTEHDCGLHYKITQARYKGRPLKDELIRKMRYLVTIRNKLVHERGFNAIPDRKAFKESFAQVEEELHAMVPQSMSTCIVS
uniref:Uncharacterized protein n=1 Tax=Chrysotila carterae TaxID=13221 RepID=A0A6T0DZY4_CHRCT|mmetsp:Transcript_47278/g.102662  ORF Transcript_47278/g.102662 Transcript_47278/m.102662 type:complete len:116 (+) Transcript_47278:52-399(+)